MVNENTLRKIIESVKKREDWKTTLPMKGDEEFLHTFQTFEFLGKNIVIAEYYDRTTNDTEWFVWEDNKLRNATDIEDYVFRTAYNEGLSDEVEMEGVITRDHNNIIYEGSGEFPSPKEEDD